MMKQLLCALLALLLLTGCSAPRLRAGYYVVSLEESEGMPMYFCLESGSTGYLHAMGQDIPTWSRELPPEYRNDLPPEYYISQMED